ncbi:UDP-glucose--hexose-1-phosphate uridylyltransferase, partial [Staphylococcus condimenti]
TFCNLLKFVQKYPHYFAGSNADLPIVGGSMLSHHPYQNGRHTFPMDHAPEMKQFKMDQFHGVRASVLKWPMSVIR